MIKFTTIMANWVQNNVWKFRKRILKYTDNNDICLRGSFFRRTLYIWSFEHLNWTLIWTLNVKTLKERTALHGKPSPGRIIPIRRPIAIWFQTTEFTRLAGSWLLIFSITARQVCFTSLFKTHLTTAALARRYDVLFTCEPRGRGFDTRLPWLIYFTFQSGPIHFDSGPLWKSTISFDVICCLFSNTRLLHSYLQIIHSTQTT